MNKIKKARDRLARAQKLLDKQAKKDEKHTIACQLQAERIKQGLQRQSPHVDMSNLSVRYDPDTKEYVALVEGVGEVSNI